MPDSEPSYRWRRTPLPLAAWLATWIILGLLEPGGAQALTPAQALAPPAAQPTSLTAIHRSGQTYLTWTERNELTGEHYRVYRHDQPISAANLAQADLLYEVPAGSARFFANRYRDYSQPPVWRDRYLARYVIEDGGAALAEGTGLLVWTLTPQDLGGGASGTGYYAVTTVAGGIENIADFDAGNSIGPVAETVVKPRPVALSPQPTPGWHAYIQFMDLRAWNPTFHAPNAGNSYYGLDSADPAVRDAIQYAYDYAVYVPTPAACSGAWPATLPLLVTLHAWQGNVYPPPAGAPNSYCAYTLQPVDETETWWFGFARNFDFRQPGLPGATDVIVNYTEQRVLQMIDDLLAWPSGPPVDPQRIYLSGHSMGASGALAMALRYPSVFAAAYASKPMTNYREAGGWLGSVQAKWGAVASNLPVTIAAPNDWAEPLAAYNGSSVWAWQNHQANLAARAGDAMVPFGLAQGINDTSIPWTTQGAPLYGPLTAGRQSWAGLVTDDAHNWTNYRGLPPTFAADARGVPFAGLQVRRDESVPGLANGSANLTQGPVITPTTTGGYNQLVRWSASWDAWDGPPTDLPTLWQISLCSVASVTAPCGGGPAQTSDVTPRRLQHFAAKAGESYLWRNRRAAGDSLIAAGAITADGAGPLTVPAVSILPAGSRLTLLPAAYPVTATLTVTLSGQGEVTATPQQTAYERGQHVTLLAVAAAGWRFAAWTGDLQGAETTATLLLTENAHQVTAQFVETEKRTLLPLILGP